MKKWLCMIFLFPVLLLSCGKDDSNDPVPDGQDKIDWNKAADGSSMALANLFWNAGEKRFNYDSNGDPDWHYWPQAHALDVLTDAWLRTKDDKFKAYFDQWYAGVKAKNGNTFENDFYDDMEWNALAILRVYQATGDAKFKEAALQIWEYIKTGWNTNAGGGITWKKGMEYSKNACSNGPACILAARLYQEFGDESYKEWAVKIYNWEKSTLFNANNGMVYDNINSETGEIKKDWIFTYNQGTFIGSAVELYKIFNEKAYLNDAVLAANYTISSLTGNSVLKSEGTRDGGLFKGIFIRYFTDLIRQDRLDATARKRYIQFIRYNAETLWTKGTTTPTILFGPDWTVKPGSVTGLTEQLSGCMLMEATAALSNEGFFE
ncbi:MAG: glycoside hydrolase family 76 protein [Mangrovibacterium sp.]